MVRDRAGIAHRPRDPSQTGGSGLSFSWARFPGLYLVKWGTQGQAGDLAPGSGGDRWQGPGKKWAVDPRLRFRLSWRERRGQSRKRAGRGSILCHFRHALRIPQKSIYCLIMCPLNLSFQLGHSERERDSLVISWEHRLTLGLSGPLRVRGD